MMLYPGPARVFRGTAPDKCDSLPACTDDDAPLVENVARAGDDAGVADASSAPSAEAAMQPMPELELVAAAAGAEVVAPEPAARSGAPGWAGGPRGASYHTEAVMNEEGARVGKLALNPAGSLDVRCPRGLRVNRTRKARAGSAAAWHHQGRPLGTLVAILWCCPGNQQAHRARIQAADALTHTQRCQARQWAPRHLTRRLLEAERPQRPGEGFSEPLAVA